MKFLDKVKKATNTMGIAPYNDKKTNEDISKVTKKIVIEHFSLKKV